MKASTCYRGDRRFESGEGAARVVMDAPADGGGLGEAPTPKQLVLYGLAGCTGLDVAVMLERQKIAFAEFEIEVEAELSGSHPKVFKQIHIRYRLAANQDDRPKVERAIELSEERFCGVSAMLRHDAKISWDLELRPLPPTE